MYVMTMVQIKAIAKAEEERAFVNDWHAWHSKRIASIMDHGKIPTQYEKSSQERCCATCCTAYGCLICCPCITLQSACFAIGVNGDCSKTAFCLYEFYTDSHKVLKLKLPSRWHEKFQADVCAVGREYLDAFDKCMAGGTQLPRVQWAKRANILREELRQMLIDNASLEISLTLLLQAKDDGDIDKLRTFVMGIKPAGV